MESNFLSSLYILDISPLSDLGLVKIIFHYVGCLLVLLTVSFALQKLCNYMRSHLSFLDLTAQAIGVLVQESFFCAHIFQALPHFLYKFQCLWLYVEFFDPLRLELCTRR
jgi:accessory gene regulator protein AgrB